MSKSIRFMTDIGFNHLISDIQSKYNLQVYRENKNLVYLGKKEQNILYVKKNEKEITTSILAYKIFYEKNCRTKSLCIEGFEEVKTRKTLLRKLENTEKIIKEYEDA